MAGRPGLPVLELNGGTGFGYEWKDQICAEPVPRFPSTVWDTGAWLEWLELVVVLRSTALLCSCSAPPAPRRSAALILSVLLLRLLRLAQR